MSTFSERLAAAKNAPRPFRDVQVILDAGLSEQREELRKALVAAKAEASGDERLSGGINPRVAEVQEKLDAVLDASAESLVTLRFTRMSGDEWSEVTARNPLRLDVPIDRHYGYNMNGVCRSAAPVSGARLEGDELIPLEVVRGTAGAPAVDEWSDLFGTIGGHEMGLIIEAVYELNEWEPAHRIDLLKKGLATRTA